MLSALQVILLCAAALAVPGLPVLAMWCGWRLARRRGRCSHTSYQGSADVVCLPCRRERARVADHLRRTTGSAP